MIGTKHSFLLLHDNHLLTLSMKEYHVQVHLQPPIAVQGAERFLSLIYRGWQEKSNTTLLQSGWPAVTAVHSAAIQCILFSPSLAILPIALFHFPDQEVLCADSGGCWGGGRCWASSINLKQIPGNTGLPQKTHVCFVLVTWKPGGHVYYQDFLWSLYMCAF